MNQHQETRTHQVSSNIIPIDSSLSNVQKFNQDKYLAKLKENSQDYIYLVKIFDYQWQEGIDSPSIQTEDYDTNLKEMLDKLAPYDMFPRLSLQIIFEIYKGMIELSRLEFKTDNITLENIMIRNENKQFRDVNINDPEQIISYLQGATYKILQTKLSNQEEHPLYNRQILDIWGQLLKRKCFQNQEDTALMLEQILKLQQNMEMEITIALIMIYFDKSLSISFQNLEKLLYNTLQIPSSNETDFQRDPFDYLQYLQDTWEQNDNEAEIQNQTPEMVQDITQLNNQLQQMNQSLIIASQAEQQLKKMQQITVIALQIVSSLSALGQHQVIKYYIDQLIILSCALILKDNQQDNLQSVLLIISWFDLQQVITRILDPKKQTSDLCHFIKLSHVSISHMVQHLKDIRLNTETLITAWQIKQLSS